MSFDFLAVLEAKVNEAARRLEELEQENQRLEHEVARLAALDSSPPPPPPLTSPAGSPAQGAKAEKPDRAEKAWTKERDEIRRRLESLIARLEALLR